MWAIDTKIKYVKFTLPKSLRKGTFVHKYDWEKRKVEFYTTINKHTIIFEIDHTSLISAIQQPNGMVASWYSSPNLIGLMKPNPHFFFFLKALKLN